MPQSDKGRESRMGCIIDNGGLGPSARTTGLSIQVVGMITRHSRAEQMSSPVSCAFRMSYPSVDLWLIVLLNRVIQFSIRTSSS